MSASMANAALAEAEETSADIQGVVAQFLTERFPRLAEDGLDAETPLLEGGHIDSLGVLDLMMFLEQRFELAISDDDFLPEHFETVGTLTAFVCSRSAA